MSFVHHVHMIDMLVQSGTATWQVSSSIQVAPTSEPGVSPKSVAESSVGNGKVDPNKKVLDNTACENPALRFATFHMSVSKA